MLFALK
jgi:hypothetical protein